MLSGSVLLLMDATTTGAASAKPATPSAPSGSTAYRDFAAAVFDRGVRLRIEIGGRPRASLDPADVESPFLRHAGIRAGARAEGERALLLVVAQWNAREFALLVAVAHAIVLVVVEAAVGAGEHQQRQRGTRLFGRVLHVGANRNDGAGAHEQRHARERRAHLDVLAAGVLIPRVEVEPRRTGR